MSYGTLTVVIGWHPNITDSGLWLHQRRSPIHIHTVEVPARLLVQNELNSHDSDTAD